MDERLMFECSQMLRWGCAHSGISAAFFFCRNTKDYQHFPKKRPPPRDQNNLRCHRSPSPLPVIETDTARVHGSEEPSTISAECSNPDSRAPSVRRTKSLRQTRNLMPSPQKLYLQLAHGTADVGKAHCLKLLRFVRCYRLFKVVSACKSSSRVLQRSGTWDDW